MAQETSAPYRCLATIEVPADQVDLYDQLLCKSADIFKRHDWRLLVRGQAAAVFDTAGAPPGLTRTLLDLWYIPDFDSLTSVMAYAADDPSYVAAQALTTSEAQNLYVALRWNTALGLPDTPVSYYLMETLHIVSSTQARENFATYMDNAIYQMNMNYGWKILFAGNATTGLLSEYVQIWGVSDLTNLEAQITAYRGVASWSAAVRRVSTSLWTPRPLPCFDTTTTTTTATGQAG